MRFDNLFYADIAKTSYADFKRLKDAGKIAPGTKFQVDLVPAHSVIWLFLVDALHAPLDPLYNDAVKREIDKIAAAIPHDELAIQFDVASAVFARLERNEASQLRPQQSRNAGDLQRHRRRSRQSRAGGVDLLYHLCYGNSNHRHVVEPTDMGDMVEFANRLTRNIKRPIDLIHMPVPRNRADDAYFEPLKGNYGRRPSYASGSFITPTASTARNNAWRRRRNTPADFSIATECGFGRRDPRTIPELLHIHAEVADWIRGNS